MPHIEIEGVRQDVDGSKNLLQICLELGHDVPYFCWHPAMGSVGSCRQCAVKQYKNEEDQQGRIVMACMTQVSDGMRYSIFDPAAQLFRDQCIEALMVNHPHDCPVCEEGGECHLQDMTNLSQHKVRLYRGKKRTFRNQQLGPFINHEMNRCITCYRCVRFYRDYADGRDLQALASRNHVYFGRHESGTLESEFSGNLVEVCPTGVFTDKTYSKHYVRKWDLQSSASICVHCGHGCNISPGERSGTLRRIVNRYNSAVNGYFLCDRGRFGYEFVNSLQRVTTPLLMQAPVVTLKNEPTFIDKLASSLKQSSLIGIGSPRASLEANFALANWVGEKNFFAGITKAELQMLTCILDIYRTHPAATPDLNDIEQADAVLILGEDVSNTDPRLALALRKASKNIALSMAADIHIPAWDAIAIQNHAPFTRSPLYIFSPHATRLDAIAKKVYYNAPQNIARLGYAIANKISAAAPSVDNLNADECGIVEEIANALMQAKRPLIVAGTQAYSLSLLHAAANISRAVMSANPATHLKYVVPECNSLGLAMLVSDSSSPGSLEDAIDTVLATTTQSGKTVVILENDLYRRTEKHIVDAFFAKAAQIIVLDHLGNDTVKKADIVLPAATFAESHGTLISSEGRAQRFFSTFLPAASIQPSWKWIAQLDPGHNYAHFDAVTEACAKTHPELVAVVDAAPNAKFRMAGQKIARQPHRYSGRTALRAHINVSEPQQEADSDSALSYSMEGMQKGVPSSMMPSIWAPAWNSNEAINKFQTEMAGPLRGGDPGIRLFDSDQRNETPHWFDSMPEKWVPQDDEYLAYPLNFIFGSDELSNVAPGLIERTPSPYISLHIDDATHLNIEENDSVIVTCGDDHFEMYAKIQSTSAPGSVGLPVGLNAFKGINSRCFNPKSIIRVHKIAAHKNREGDQT